MSKCSDSFLMKQLIFHKRTTLYYSFSPSFIFSFPLLYKGILSWKSLWKSRLHKFCAAKKVLFFHFRFNLYKKV